MLENDVGRGSQGTDNEGASWIMVISFYCDGKPLKRAEQGYQGIICIQLLCGE